MSIFNPPGYLAPPRASLGSELIGFNPKTGRFVQAAAGVGSPDGLGSYLDLSPDYYKTFQHDNWQHPGSEGWSSANVPGWGNNPNLQMFARRGTVSGLGTARPVAGGLETAGKGGLVFLALIGVFLYVAMTNDDKPPQKKSETRPQNVYG